MRRRAASEQRRGRDEMLANDRDIDFEGVAVESACSPGSGGLSRCSHSGLRRSMRRR